MTKPENMRIVETTSCNAHVFYPMDYQLMKSHDFLSLTPRLFYNFLLCDIYPWQKFSEDKCTGAVPQTVFQTLMHKYETERAQKAASLPELEQKVKAQLENRNETVRKFV